MIDALKVFCGNTNVVEYFCVCNNCRNATESNQSVQVDDNQEEVKQQDMTEEELVAAKALKKKQVDKVDAALTEVIVKQM